MASDLPEKIGRYPVERQLGQGAMGVVYQCRDPALDVPVAVKVLHRHASTDEVSVARFRREAEMLARLRHPGIVRIRDADVRMGVPFIVMDFLEGRSLGAVLRHQSRLSQRRALRIVHDIAEALQHAHESGVVHRDLKPDNVILVPGDRLGEERPVLTDFGLAFDEIRPADLTISGYVVGTPLYMSPEQATGVGPVDGLSDIYSLGVILFELVTGTNPYEAPSVSRVMRRAARAILPAPRAMLASVHPEVDAVVVRATARERQDRPATARALAEEIDAILPDVPDEDSSKFEVRKREKRRHTHERPTSRPLPFAVLVLGSVVLSAAAAAATVLLVMKPAPDGGGGNGGQTENGGGGGTASSGTGTGTGKTGGGAGAGAGTTGGGGASGGTTPPPDAATLARAERHIGLALAALGRVGGETEALSEADAALAIVADHPPASALRARALMRLGRNDEASEAWEAAFHARPALLLEHAHHDLSRAHPTWRSQRTRWLDDAATRAGSELLRTALRSARRRLDGERSGATSIFRELDALARDHPLASGAAEPWTAFETAEGDVVASVHLERALWLWRLERFDDAIAATDRIAAAHPGWATAQLVRGRFLAHRRRLGQADRALAAALRTRPDLIGPSVTRGWIALWEYRPDDADRHFREAQAIDARSGAPVAGLAVVSALRCFFTREGRMPERRLGLIDDAVELSRQAMERSPESSDALLGRALARILTGDVTGSDEDLAAALRRAPSNPRAHRIRIELLKVTNRVRQALEAADEFVRRSPDPVQAKLLRADLLQMVGRFDEADRLFAELDEAWPEDPEILLRWAEIWFAASVPGDLRAAERCLELTGLCRSADPDAFDRYSRAWFGFDAEGSYGNVERVVALCRLRERDLPASEEAGRLLESGDVVAAERALREAASREPLSPIGHAELAALYLDVDREEVLSGALGIDGAELARRGLQHAQRAGTILREPIAFVEWVPVSLAAAAVGELRVASNREGARRALLQARQFLDARDRPRIGRLDALAERLAGRAQARLDEGD